MKAQCVSKKEHSQVGIANLYHRQACLVLKVSTRRGILAEDEKVKDHQKATPGRFDIKAATKARARARSCDLAQRSLLERLLLKLRASSQR